VRSTIVSRRGWSGSRRWSVRAAGPDGHKLLVPILLDGLKQPATRQMSLSELATLDRRDFPAIRHRHVESFHIAPV
jgi:hypothetical protein